MKLQYRPEIEGLKSIAILAIIIYHANIVLFGHTFFKGGFIGIDIFFVISGYLITSLIVNEIKTKNSFSFLYFYEQRIRRLLPALYVVILISLPVAFLYLLPVSLIDYIQSIVSSIFFISNFYFWYFGAQFFDESSLLKPFFNLWSVSIIQQFYIFFPIALFICIKFFQKYLTIILILTLIFSLIIADWSTRTHPSFNFFILTTRGWEFLSGAIIARLEISYGRTNNKILNPILSILGLALIIHSIIFFDDEMFYPSFFSISPIIGTMLVLWFTNKDTLVLDILSNKLFLGLGLISYSLYLWHYPIFAFGRNTNLINDSDNADSIFVKIFLITAIIFFSILSYFFVERPFKNKKIISIRMLVISILCLSVCLITILFFINKQMPEFLKKDLKIFPLKKNQIFHWNLLTDENGKCHFRNENFCSFNKNGKKGTVFLVGDSHMASISNDVYKEFNKKDYNFISITGGCLYLPEFNLIHYKTGQVVKYCNFEYQNNIKQVIQSFPNSIVILGGRLPLYLSNHLFDNKEGGIEYWDGTNDYHSYTHHINNEITSSQGIISSIKDILENNHKVILIYPIPEIGWNLSQKMFNLIPKNITKIEGFLKNNKYLITTSYDVYKERTKKSFKVLNSIQHPNLYRVYPDKLFCNNLVKGRCITHDENHMFFMDSNHLTTTGSSMVVKLIMKEIEKIESNQ